MTFLNLRGIKLVANFNSLIVIMQFSIIAVFIGLIAWGVSHGEGWARWRAAALLLRADAHPSPADRRLHPLPVVPRV